MARKQVGRVPLENDDAVDKNWAQGALATKYTKPPLGIPTTDIAPSAITVDRLQASGPPSDKTVLYGDGRWGVILGNFLVVQPEDDYTLVLPETTPADGEMLLVEVLPGGGDPVIITVPENIRLTSNLERSYEAAPGRAFFLGLRWSARAAAWHLLTVANELV